MKDNMIGRLGLCRRAGKLEIGFDAAAAAVKKGTAALVLTAQDISPKTAKELHFLADPRGIAVATLPLSKDEVGAALGLSKAVGAVAVTDTGFAGSFVKLCHQKEETI